MSSGADAAVVLAGGAGTRVGGRDKGLLAWHGTTLAAHALQRLADAGFEEIVVSANRNLDDYARLGRAVFADAEPAAFLGPLAGIARALGTVRAPRLFTVPVDVPDWPLDLPRRLAACLDAGNAACAVARVGGRREPLFALYGAQCVHAACDALDEGRFSVREFQDAVGCVELSLPDSWGPAFANLNTAGALGEARA